MSTLSALKPLAKSSKPKSEEFCEYNGIPNFPPDFLFVGKFKIVERIGWDDTVGGTFFVTPIKSDRPLELVLRIGNLKHSTGAVMGIELGLITEAEAENQHQKFAQFHQKGRTGNYLWYTTYFREGPSLCQISDFMATRRPNGSKFSASTVGRFAVDIFEIVGYLHKRGFLLCAMDKTIFHFDAATRRLFLADLSSIRKAATNPKTRYCLDFEPIEDLLEKSEQRELMNLELGSAFLLVLELALGELPWARLGVDKASALKWKLQNDPNQKGFLADLDPIYSQLWAIIHSIALSPKTYESIQPIIDLFQKLYREVGGCVDLDEDYDFERQPNEDEIPRFVLEREDNTEMEAALCQMFGDDEELESAINEEKIAEECKSMGIGSD